MAIRKKTVILKLAHEEWEDLLSCITITQRDYCGKKNSPEFMAAVEKLRGKMWRDMRKQESKRKS